MARAIIDQVLAVCPVSSFAEFAAMTADELSAAQAKWPAALWRRFDSGAVWRFDVDGTDAQRAAAQALLDAAEYEPDPVPRRLVQKSVIVDRLHAAGKLDAAFAALNGADLYTRQRWEARNAIYSDDPTALALLQAIGADPAVILAAE